MKRRDLEFETLVREALKGKKVPILVWTVALDTLFRREKNRLRFQLEEKLNELLKRQGYLVNDIKDLKKTKKKLMEGIVAGMNDAEPLRDKKKETRQRLLLEIKERIDESDELIELPRMIKKANEELLAHRHIIVLSVWQMEI